LDSIFKQGLESCAIGFLNAKKELVTGTTSDRKGYFELAIRPGKHQMVLDFRGYKKRIFLLLSGKIISFWVLISCSRIIIY